VDGSPAIALRLLRSRKTAALALALSVLSGLYFLMNARTFQAFGKLVARVPTRAPLVALTFDDGPQREPVQLLLPMLAAHKAHATFFVEGRELEHDLELGRQLVAAGHELGNHSYSHERMVLKSQAFIASEIERTDRAIRAAGQRDPIYFRPPFGKKLLGLPWYLAQHDRTTVMWDIEADARARVTDASPKLVDPAVARVQPGSIILMHVMQPSRRASLRALPGILSSLNARGFRFATISELMASDHQARMR
jgi:peptidoglycan/xylan/chitin deacetylase (PgdA/CDA1 family)